MERSWLRKWSHLHASHGRGLMHAGITAKIDPASRIPLTPQLSHSFGSWHLAFFLLRIPEDRIDLAPTNRRISRFLLVARLRYCMLECFSFNGWTTGYSTNQERRRIRRGTSFNQSDSPVSRSYGGIVFFQICDINYLGSTPGKMTSDTRIWDRR